MPRASLFVYTSPAPHRAAALRRRRSSFPSAPIEKMTHRIVLFLVLLCLAMRAEAAMVLVVEVADGRTLVVDRNGQRERLRLAGVEITNEVHARALLQWTLAGSWAMVEPRGDGYFVYRSPDALFINRELVQRGFARATRTDVDPQPAAMVTYLGIVQPMNPQATEKSKATRTTTRSRRGASATAPPKTNSGTSRRPSRSPSPSSRKPAGNPSADDPPSPPPN